MIRNPSRSGSRIGVIEKNILVIIDPQIDFHPEGGTGKYFHPTGSLAVPGANEDSQRIAAFIREHTNDIDDIYVTLDSHHRTHIAHGIFWENEKGDSPNPFTVITTDDISTGKWLPRNRALKDHALWYTKRLSENGRFQLTIWPEHCLIGSVGHAVVPEVHEALQEWCGLTSKTIKYIMKGQNVFTEMYSCIAADVEMADDDDTKKNVPLLEDLLRSSKLIFCGQALSHCVSFTVRDIVKECLAKGRKTSDIFVAIDASSPVQGFEEAAKAFVAEVKAQGVQCIKIGEIFTPK